MISPKVEKASLDRPFWPPAQDTAAAASSGTGAVALFLRSGQLQAVLPLTKSDALDKHYVICHMF